MGREGLREGGFELEWTEFYRQEMALQTEEAADARRENRHGEGVHVVKNLGWGLKESQMQKIRCKPLSALEEGNSIIEF